MRQPPSRHGTAEGAEEWTPQRSHDLLLTTPTAFIKCQYSTSWCGREKYSQAMFPLKALLFQGLCLLCFHWAWMLFSLFFFQIRIIMLMTFTNQLLCTAPPEEFCGRIPSSSFFIYIYIYMKEVMVFVDKTELELRASRCLSSSTGKTWVGIWASLLRLSPVLDTSADIAFRRECDLGMRYH